MNIQAKRLQVDSRLMSKLPYELREMIYWFTFCESTDCTTEPPTYSQGPESIKVIVSSDLKSSLQFEGNAHCLTMMDPDMLQDMQEYLKDTFFVADSYYSTDLLGQWCSARNTYDVIQKLQIDIISSYFDRRDVNNEKPHIPGYLVLVIPELQSLNEVILNMNDYHIDEWLKRFHDSDIVHELRKHTTLAHVASMILEKPLMRKVKIMGGNTADYKMMMHKIRDVVAGTVVSGSTVVVELDAILHIRSEEMDEKMREDASYACCREIFELVEIPKL
jgi:hypothetical protein